MRGTVTKGRVSSCLQRHNPLAIAGINEGPVEREYADIWQASSETEQATIGIARRYRRTSVTGGGITVDSPQLAGLHKGRGGLPATDGYEPCPLTRS